MKLKSLIFSSILMLALSSNSSAQSDGCIGVPILPMGLGVCNNTAFSLPGAFSNGGLVNASCATSNDRDDGWFQFTTGLLQTEVNIEETSTNRRHLISVWTSCGGGTELGCDQENSGVTATLNLTGLTPSTTYFIQIHRRSGNNNAAISGNICVYEPIPQPPVPEDCEGGTTVCADGNFSGNSSGSGNVSDLDASNHGCLSSNENESSWYFFQAASDGIYEFNIITTVDYDFAVWGPVASVTCPPTGAPLRCSYSGTAGNTGLQVGAGDQTEGAGGDAVVDEIVATSGDQFILIIDNFSADGSGFTLDWTLSGGASLDCTPLPIEMANFSGEAKRTYNQLNWETKSEIDSKKMIIEKSENGENFEEIGSIEAAGNSSSTIEYSFRDTEIHSSFSYYRIKMVDNDLSYEYSHTLSIQRENKEILIHPNPNNGEFTFVFPNNQISQYAIVYRNLAGQVVSENIELENYQNKYESSALSNMDAGIYFVEITDKFGSLIEYKRIIKE